MLNFSLSSLGESIALNDTGERFSIEWRNLRAQVAEARAAGHPVNLFEVLAQDIAMESVGGPVYFNGHAR